MGATELVLGLDLGMGTLIGLIFGGLVGILCAMMAGTRTAKPEIAAAASALEAPQVLVLLTCEDGGDVAFLRRFASEAGIDGAAVC